MNKLSMDKRYEKMESDSSSEKVLFWDHPILRKGFKKGLYAPSG